MEIKIEDSYREAIAKSPNILGVRFIHGQPVEVINKDLRWNNDEQVLLTREEILGDFENRTSKKP